jgi:hypothetical protein
MKLYCLLGIGKTKLWPDGQRTAMAFLTKADLLAWFNLTSYSWHDFEIVVFEEKAKKKGNA